MLKIIKCAFCSGIGKDPYALLSATSDCLVCKGTGQVEVEEPAIACVFCSGTGKNPLGARVTCIVCGGKGMNYCKGNTKCNQCKGSGKWSDGLPCTRCGGKGLI
jgi:DnaJ-class molecular chaperone